MSYSAMIERLRSGEVVLMDGPTGTELQRRGVAMDAAAWCGPATLDNDAVLTEIHLDYIQAGSEVITANTFSASKLMLAGAGLEERSAEIVERAVAAALRARESAPHPDRVVIAGSLSHMVPVASGSAAVDPALTPPPTQIADAFSDLAQNLKRFGCDLLILEMMYNPIRVPLALAAAQASGLPIWFGLSARADAAGNLLSFDQLESLPLSRIMDMIPARGIDVAGVMHTPAPLISAVTRELRTKFSGPLMAYPDSGYFEMPDWKFVNVLAEDRFESYCLEWLRQGVQLLGGCCGLSPAHIRAAARARQAYLQQRPA